MTTTYDDGEDFGLPEHGVSVALVHPGQDGHEPTAWARNVVGRLGREMDRRAGASAGPDHRVEKTCAHLLRSKHHGKRHGTDLCDRCGRIRPNGIRLVLLVHAASPKGIPMEVRIALCVPCAEREHPEALVVGLPDDEEPGVVDLATDGDDS